VQVCTSLQTDNHTSTSPLSFFTGRMPFLPPNQQRQSTEGTGVSESCLIKLLPRILSEKYIYILALVMASPGNRHYANCIGALSFPMKRVATV